MNLKVCSIKCKIVFSTWVAAFIFTASLVAGNRPFPTTADTLSFLHITDMHLMFNLENYDRDIVYHREYTRNYKEGNSLFNQFMKTVPDQTGSDMIIATGDIIDFYDAKTKEGNVFAYQVEPFARFINGYHRPFYMTLGNHDIFSYDWGKNRVIPNQLQAGQARAACIRNFDCFRDGTYYSQVYEIGETTYRLIFLDNSYYQFNKDEGVVNPYIDKSQLHWLRAELNALEDDVEIILMHIPFTEKSALPESANELFAAIIEDTSVRLILAGHHHRGAVMHFQQANGNEIVQVETGALVSGVDNWRLIRLTEKNILVSLMGETGDELVIPVD